MEKLKITPDGTKAVERQKEITLCKGAILQATRAIEMQMKSATVTEEDVAPHNATIGKCQGILGLAERTFEEENVKRLTELKSCLIPQLTEMIDVVEKQVEKTKDEAALFTSEFAEQLTPEHTMEAKKKTEAEMNPATEQLKKIKEFITNKNKEMQAFSPDQVAQIREDMKALQVKMIAKERELLSIRSQMSNAVKKAEAIILKKQRAIEMEKRIEEQKANREMNQAQVQFGLQISPIIDKYNREINLGAPDATVMENGRILGGFRAELQRRMEQPEVIPPTRNSLMTQIRKIDNVLTGIRNRLNEKENRNMDSIREAIVKVAMDGKALRGKKDEQKFFLEYADRRSKKMTLDSYIKFVKKLGITEKEKATAMWKETVKMIGENVKEIELDDFNLHVLSVIYKVTKQTVLTQTEETGEGEVLDFDSYVDIIEGPKDVNGVIRVKVKVLKEEPQEGWATLRGNGMEFMARYYPHFTVLQETVLTDEFDIKHFNVVARIKVDEKMRATTVPKILVRVKEQEGTTATMVRVKGIISEHPTGWVTLTGNKGSTMFKHEEYKAPPKEPLPVKDFDREEFEKALLKFTEEALKEIKEKMEELVDAKEKVCAGITEVGEMDKEGQEPTQEEVERLLANVDESWTLFTRSMTTLRTKIQVVHRENTTSGGVHMNASMKEDLEKIGQEMAEHSKTVNELKLEHHKQANSVRMKEKQRRMLKEKQMLDEMAEELNAGLSPHMEAAQKVFTEVTQLNDDVNNMTPTLELRNLIEETNVKLAEAETIATEALEWIEENGPAQQYKVRPQIIEISKNITWLRLHCSKLTHVCENWKYRLTVLETQLLERTRVELSFGLLAFAKKLTPAEVFAKNCKKDVMQVAEFETFVSKKCKLELTKLDEICKHIGAKEGLTKDLFCSLFKIHFIVTKPIIMTNILEIRNEKLEEVKSLEKEDILEMLEDYVKEEETGLIRFKARTVMEGKEGFVTAKGNRSVPPGASRYIRALKPAFKLTKSTVLSDRLSVSGDEKMKVFRKLRVGEIMRMLELPKEESGLTRMKVVCLQDNLEGYVTMVGNKEGLFVQDCDIPDVLPSAEDLEEAEKKRAEEEREKKEAERKEEQAAAEAAAEAIAANAVEAGGVVVEKDVEMKGASEEVAGGVGSAEKDAEMKDAEMKNEANAVEEAATA